MRILSRHCKLPAIESTVSVLERCPYREVQLHLNKDYSLYRCVRYLFSLATILNFIVIIHQYLWQFIPGLHGSSIAESPGQLSHISQLHILLDISIVKRNRNKLVNELKKAKIKQLFHLQISKGHLS